MAKPILSLLMFLALAGSVLADDSSVQKRTFTNHIGMVMVWIPEGFWVGKYEVTQKEYVAVMGKNPSKFKDDRNPVERVNWHDAMAFCKALSKLESESGTLPNGFAYTLPTEKQWHQFVADASLEDAVHGRYGPNKEPLGPVEVGTRGPNRLGLHDVRGNVWEWCLNEYMANSTWKVLRGGAWSVSDPENLAIGVRLNVEPETAYEFYGFRCVLGPAGSAR